MFGAQKCFCVNLIHIVDSILSEFSRFRDCVHIGFSDPKNVPNIELFAKDRIPATITIQVKPQFNHNYTNE